MVSGASAVLEAAGVAARCRIEAGDFFERVPSGGDVYVLSQIVHDWDDERAGQMLRGCRAAMAPGARWLWWSASCRKLGTRRRRATPSDFLADMHMMAILTGRERTASEFMALLAGAGFAPQTILATRSTYRLVQSEALPPPDVG